MDKAVIFDLDGVLIETEPETFKFYKDYLKQKFGIILSNESFEKKAGRKSVDFFNDVLTPSQREQVNVQKLTEFKREQFEKYFTKFVKPVFGAKEVISRLSVSGYSLALASQNEKRMIDTAIDYLQVRPYFNLILSLDDISKKKPDPEIYILAMKKLGVTPNKTIVVEDSEAGILAGKAAGATVIALRHPYTPKAHLKQASHIIGDLKEIFKFL